MIYALCLPDHRAFRPVFLFWAGSIINSLYILLPGAAVGSSSHQLTFSTLLNVPYVLIPVYFAIKTLKSPRPVDHPVAPKPTSLLVELGFAAFFCLFAYVSVLRFAVAANSQWACAVAWLQDWEPILTDPSSFFRVEAFVYFYYLAPAAAAFIVALLHGGPSLWVRDAAYLTAGAVAQSQFTHMRCASHWDTAAAHRSDHSPHFWLLNIALFVGPQLFAYYLWTNSGAHGILNLLTGKSQ